MKLPLRKENDARLLRDERSDRADGGRLPWKDDRAEGGRKLIVGLVYSLLRRGATLVFLSLWATLGGVALQRLPSVERLPSVGGRLDGVCAAAGVFLQPFAGAGRQLQSSRLAAGRSTQLGSTSARRASSRRTHKGGRGSRPRTTRGASAARVSSSRAPVAWPPRKGPVPSRTPSPQQRKTRMCSEVIWRARALGSGGVPSVRRLRALRPSRPPR